MCLASGSLFEGMLARLARQIGTLVLAFGIILGAVGPSWAGMNPSHKAAMVMVKMQGDCMGMAKKQTNNKQMPCDGTGCGCCLCGTCATPSANDVALSVHLLERSSENGIGDDVFEAAVKHIETLRGDGKRVILAGWSDGSRERLGHVLAEHGLKKIEPVSSLAQTIGLQGVALAVIGVEQGFVAGDLAVIGEQDILGDRLVRAKGKKRRGADFIAEAASLSANDLVVHVDHGIARFLGLKTIEVGGAPHDCCELEYVGGDRLFLPVENIELLSRYGSDETTANLDRLGGGGWQARKAKLKERIREMAGKLMAIAAARALKEAPDSASIWSNLGTAHFARKKYDDAMQCYEKAMALDPDVFEHKSSAGVLLQERSVEERAKFHYYQAKLYAKKGMNDRALLAVLERDELLGLAEIDAARQLADDDDVEVVDQFALQRRGVGEGGVADRRAEIGEETEVLAQAQEPRLGTGLVGYLLPFWAANRGEQHGVGSHRPRHGLVGDRLAMRVVGGAADEILLAFEPGAAVMGVEPRDHRLQLGHDLLADAVAR